MRVTRLLVVAFLISIAASLATAQDAIRLQFEIVKDGSTVAEPEVSVISGSPGTIERDDVGRIAFTPTFRGSEAVAIAFDITSGEKHLQPRLVITRTQPGTLSWTSDAHESLKLTVSWVR